MKRQSRRLNFCNVPFDSPLLLISKKVRILFHVEHWKHKDVDSQKGNKPDNDAQAAMVVLNPFRTAA